MEDAIKYTGEEKIVISMDVGTTQSKSDSCGSIFDQETHIRAKGAVSYIYLYPNMAPEVKMVRVRRSMSTLLTQRLRLPNGQDNRMQWEMLR